MEITTIEYKPTFWRTREYLQQVRDKTRQKELLEQRIDLRRNDPDGNTFHDVEDLDRELLNVREEVNDAKIDVTDLAAKLPEVDEQMVISKRYVDLKSWEEIAGEMGCTVRTVQKLHGRALPVLDELVMKYNLEKGIGIGDVAAY